MTTADQIRPINDHTLKSQLKQTWCAGDYATIAETLAASSYDFLKRHPVQPGNAVLDVGCGAGQIAFPAAKAGARVAGIDIADNLIEQARARAGREGVPIRFDVGDAESLPYDDDQFDQVYSVIGAMFAPNPDQAAAELKRVCKSGGQIIMANWTPEGFIGQFFKTVAKHMPPPEGMPSPLMWGVESHVRSRFGDDLAELNLGRNMFEFRYPFGPARVVEVFRQYFGPVNRAFATLDDSGQAALREDLEQLWSDHNQATDGTTYTEGEILEVVAIPNKPGSDPS